MSLEPNPSFFAFGSILQMKKLRFRDFVTQAGSEGLGFERWWFDSSLASLPLPWPILKFTLAS